MSTNTKLSVRRERLHRQLTAWKLASVASLHRSRSNRRALQMEHGQGSESRERTIDVRRTKDRKALAGSVRGQEGLINIDGPFMQWGGRWGKPPRRVLPLPSITTGADGTG